MQDRLEDRLDRKQTNNNKKIETFWIYVNICEKERSKFHIKKNRKE